MGSCDLILDANKKADYKGTIKLDKSGKPCLIAHMTKFKSDFRCFWPMNQVLTFNLRQGINDKDVKQMPRPQVNSYDVDLSLSKFLVSNLKLNWRNSVGKDNNPSRSLN